MHGTDQKGVKISSSVSNTRKLCASLAALHGRGGCLSGSGGGGGGVSNTKPAKCLLVLDSICVKRLNLATPTASDTADPVQSQEPPSFKGSNNRSKQ